MINTDDVARVFSQFFDTPRPGQIDAIVSILNHFESGKRFVVLEAPTGAGKSAIALTVSEFFARSYYLTVTKILQSQVVKDYEAAGMVDLKGRNAYPCTFFQNFGAKLVSKGLLGQADLDKQLQKPQDCNNGYCRKQRGKSKCELCCPREPEHIQTVIDMGFSYSACPYYEQVGKAAAASRTLMNFSSFLFQFHYTNGRFGNRDLLIIDEAHQTESQLMSFVSVSISDTVLSKCGLALPDFDDPREYALWFHDNDVAKQLDQLATNARLAGDTKAEDEFKSLAGKVEKFVYYLVKDDSEWVIELKRLPGMGNFKQLTLRPVFINQFAEDLIFCGGKKVLLMSATILDPKVVCYSLGIKQDDMAYLSLPSTFPKENRPIYVTPQVKVVGGKDKMGEWGPKVVSTVDNIVKHYRGQRGIVHTHNFAIARMLMDQCKQRQRFLFQDNFRDKAELLQRHSESSDTVIVAPAMHEGLDLHGDLSRFQIICKTPYPNHHEDMQLSRRVDLDRRYLTWLTLLKLVQSYGRSVRSETDWADTYIIDAKALQFLKESRSMQPRWFSEALILS